MHTNRRLSRQYITNMNCAQKLNTFQTVHQKCVLCTETEHFPDGTSEMCSMQRKRTLSRRNIRNTCCALKQENFQTVHQKCVRCTQSEPVPDGMHKTFQTVRQTCILRIETERFPDGTSEMCTVYRKRTLSRRQIRNVYCAQIHNTFHTVRQTCILCTEVEHIPNVHISSIYRSQNDIEERNSLIYSHSNVPTYALNTN